MPVWKTGYGVLLPSLNYLNLPGIIKLQPIIPQYGIEVLIFKFTVLVQPGLAHGAFILKARSFFDGSLRGEIGYPATGFDPVRPRIWNPR